MDAPLTARSRRPVTVEGPWWGCISSWPGFYCLLRSFGFAGVAPGGGALGVAAVPVTSRATPRGARRLAAPILMSGRTSAGRLSLSRICWGTTDVSSVTQAKVAIWQPSRGNEFETISSAVASLRRTQ